MRKEGSECGEKTREHGGVERRADEVHFYHAGRPWRGQRSGVCVCLSPQSALMGAIMLPVAMVTSDRPCVCKTDFRRSEIPPFPPFL